MPTHMGPYRIRESLTEGAITSLHRAEHERLGRVVLLKSLKKGLADGSPLASILEREAQMLGRLAHPSIPRLLDISPDVPPTWLALEWIDGVPLAKLLDKAKILEVPTALAIALELAQGLGHAHLRHVVHRHVDPQGIVICRDGRVMLMDFGLADEDRPHAESRFEPMEGARGHRYTAPEQIMGEPATPMSDVFSLGMVLYEMICGQGPWDGGKPTPTELSRRIRSEEPAPLEVQGRRIPNDVSALVLRCLAKRPEERFEDGTALAIALESALDALSLSPLPVLVTRALYVAGMGEALADDKTRRRKQKPITGRSLQQLGGQFASLFALIMAGAVVLEVVLRETDAVRVSEENLQGTERGFLRVLARPWAEVFVDGRLVDVTPMAKPIVVTVGRHYVTFKHPNALDEQRDITITSGQTVLVDVTMRIERATMDAGRDATPDAPASP